MCMHWSLRLRCAGDAGRAEDGATHCCCPCDVHAMALTLAFCGRRGQGRGWGYTLLLQGECDAGVKLFVKTVGWAGRCGLQWQHNVLAFSSWTPCQSMVPGADGTGGWDCSGGATWRLSMTSSLSRSGPSLAGAPPRRIVRRARAFM